MSGREIFAKRDQLRMFGAALAEGDGQSNYNEDPAKYRVTNEYQVTSELVIPPLGTMDAVHVPSVGKKSSSSDAASNSKGYSVNITSARPSLPRNQTSRQRKNKATMEANHAAFGYAKVASLFFISLLVSWVPSSLNRVYSLIHPHAVSVQYAYAASIVLSLMGFWNAVIYISTSHRACRSLLISIRDGNARSLMTKDVAELANRKSRIRSDGDSLEGLADQRESD